MFRVGEEIHPDIFNNLIEIIQKRGIEINRFRTQSGEGRSQCFGIVRQRTGHYSGSRMNFARMDIFQELQNIARVILPPDFTYTSIQVNENYQSLSHQDSGNRGESAIIGFGDYLEGDLQVEQESVSIKYSLVFFDGSLYTHWTRPFSGNRYSLVFHTPKPFFTAIPIYKVVGETLQEDLNGISRIYSKRGKCLYSSDGVIPVVIPRRHTLRDCVV